MPSPFPGMNPYIERAEVWEDFHTHFMSFAVEILVPQVRPRYFVKIAENVYIHERSADERRPLGKPDLSVTPAAGPRPSPVASAAGPGSAAPAAVLIPEGIEETRVPFLEIRDRTDRQVITVVELLSPANKYAGPDRDQYRAKARRVLATPTHFVEIDLLRGGPRMPWGDMPACDYYAAVSRAVDRPRADFWPVRLRDPLPRIPVPLRPGEPEPTLDLQALLHRVYDSAGYELFIYDGDPEPRLPPDDAAWAAALRPPRP